ncbi:MAG: hypothetical protein ACPLUL_08745 [Thermanaerothrix sp.]|uniref:hypothetical protein n=1 Tax=Thermanaerothrix sp. TaxID=2972675 RepID=UPI003C7C3D26
MKRVHYFILGLIGAGIAAMMLWTQPVAAVMDSDYYYALGQQIFWGRGGEQPFIWNYLADPKGVPMPAFDYWMPLPAVLAAIGMWLVGTPALWAARLPFVALHGVNVVLVAYWVFRKTGQRLLAWLGGLAVSFPIFYAGFITFPESFTPIVTLGTLYFILVFGAERIWGERAEVLRSLSVGVLCGLFHLSRADGVVWLLASIFLQVGMVLKPMISKQVSGIPRKMRVAILNILVMGVGYVLMITPWLWHNLQAFGTLFQPGSGRVLWLREYNELFYYPASQLTFEHWIGQGWGAIIKDRLWALGQNLLTAIAVQGQVVFFPLIIWGIVKTWPRFETRFGFGMWLGMGLIFSLVFPFAGVRGGFFHSGAALQPFLWVLGWQGFQALIEWGTQHRRWQPKVSQGFLGVGILLIVFAASAVIYFQRYIGDEERPPAWQVTQDRYMAINHKLSDWGFSPESSLGAVNNPPTFFVLTHRSSIVIPGGDVSQLLAAMCRYQADYVILEPDQVNLETLYANPTSVEALKYLETVQGAHILALEDAEKTCR